MVIEFKKVGILFIKPMRSRCNEMMQDDGEELSFTTAPPSASIGSSRRSVMLLFSYFTCVMEAGGQLVVLGTSWSVWEPAGTQWPTHLLKVTQNSSWRENSFSQDNYTHCVKSTALISQFLVRFLRLHLASNKTFLVKFRPYSRAREPV